MKLQRAIALALLVAAATVFGMTSRTFVLPAIACVLAAIGVTRRFVLTSPVRPFLAGMLLALVFLAIGRISPFDNPSVRAFLFYPVAYSIGQFLLVWMAVQFFLRRPTGLPALLPLYAVGVCVCVPTHTDTRPSICQPIAIFSLLTSAWKSSTLTFTSFGTSASN